jgi:hypothetical protein
MATGGTGPDPAVRVDVARGIPPEMAVAAEPEDPRVWVQAEQRPPAFE